MIILIHDCVPCALGRDYVIKQKSDMEHCSTVVYPNYNYEQKLTVAGIYRPPKAERPPYDKALEIISQQNKTRQITANIAGNLNINSRKTDVHRWIAGNKLWELTDPHKSTF